MIALQQYLMASLEREGVQGRQRHNEWAMTRAQRDGERDGGRDKERWRLYSRWVNMERESGRRGGDVK